MPRDLQPAVLLIAMTMIAVGRASMTIAPPPGNDRITVQNLMPDFWRFWSAANHQPPDKQLALWHTLYMQPNASVFADLDAVCRRHFDGDELKKEYFPIVNELAPGMRSLSESLPSIIGIAEQRFRKAFPDMRWSGDIYTMASAGCFNGRAQTIRGRESLLLGLDNIVGLHETNLPPLLEHELFHRYHHTFFAFEPQLDEPLWVRLWAEGLATFVARELNPSATNRDLMFIDEKEMVELHTREASIAADFLTRFDSRSSADADLYFSDRSGDAKIPARAGYYLGLSVSQRLASQYPLRSMSRWKRAEAEPLVLATLKRMQREP